MIQIFVFSLIVSVHSGSSSMLDEIRGLIGGSPPERSFELVIV